MIITGSWIFQINQIETKKPLTKSKDLSQNLILKLLCDVIFSSLPGQCNIPSLKMANFQLDDYPWQPKFSSHTKLKQKALNYIKKPFRKF